MTDKTEKIIYFVRHGESLDNVAPVFQGADSPLSPRGRGQAESIAKRVSKLNFESLVSSPLPRTRETAEIIAVSTGKKPIFSDLFVERIKPTAIEGKPYTDKAASILWREWEKSLYAPGMRAANGENFDDIISRAANALEFLEEQPTSSIVVVTHGYFLRTIIAKMIFGNSISGSQLREFQSIAEMDNTGLTIIRKQTAFEEDSKWRLWVYNDHSHLAE